MNGRVYDYNVGRFMSVDPLIHTEAGSQGINPYSYIFNNLLSGTDPTGYDAEQEKPKKETVTGSRIKGNSVAASGIKGNFGSMAKASAAAGRAKTQAKIDAFAGMLNSAINNQMGNGATSQTASTESPANTTNPADIGGPQQTTEKPNVKDDPVTNGTEVACACLGGSLYKSEFQTENDKNAAIALESNLSDFLGSNV